MLTIISGSRDIYILNFRRLILIPQESGQPVPGDDNWKRLGSEESPVYIRRPSQRKSNNDDTLSFTSASPPPPNNAAPSISTDPRHIHEQQIDDQSGQQRLSGWLPARQRPSRLVSIASSP